MSKRISLLRRLLAEIICRISGFIVAFVAVRHIPQVARTALRVEEPYLQALLAPSIT